MNKTIFRDTVVYAVLPHISKIVGLFFLPFMMKFLDSKDYGIYGIVIAYSTLFSFAKDLGLYNTFFVTYFNYKNNYKIIWNRLFGILTLWAFIYSVLVFFVLYFGLYNSTVDRQNLFLLIIIVVIPIAFFDNSIMISGILLRLQKKIIITSIVFMFSGLLTVLLNFFFIVGLKIGYIGFFLSMFISSFFVFIVFYFMVLKRNNLYPIFRFKYRQVYSFLKIGLPMIPHNYSTYMLSTSDKLIMNYYKLSISKIGSYSFGNTISNYFAPIDNAIGYVFYPYYIENIANKEHLKNQKLIVISHIFIFIITTSLSIWAKEIFDILTDNKEFSNSYVFFIFFIMSYNYRPFYMATTWQLIQQERTKALLKISFTSGLISVIFNIVLLPYTNIIISSLIYFLSFIYLGFINSFIEKDKMQIKINYKQYLFTILISMLIIYTIKDYNYVNKTLVQIVFLTYFILSLIKYRKYH